MAILRVRPRCRSLVSVSVSLSLFVCASLVVTAEPLQASEGQAAPVESKTLSPEQVQELKEYEAELELGRGMAGRLLQQFKPLEDKALNDYVTKVGLVVAQSSPFASRQFVFGVLDSDAINAFAMPGGYIFVTRGSLQNAESEAELAAILGHEIAHVGHRHIYNAMLSRSRAKKKEAGGEAPETVTARRRPESASSETAQTLTRLVGGQLNILAAVQSGFSVLFEEGLDPKFETEADTEAIQFALNAGYDPKALAQYFERVVTKRDPAQTKILSKTHPPLTGRIKTLNAAVSQSVPKDYRGALGRERFQAAIAPLTKKGPAP